MLEEPFADGDPGPGWLLKDQEMKVVGTGRTPDGILKPGEFWQSPPFEVQPFEYFRIEVETSGDGRPLVCGMGFNPDATWGRFPHREATTGELVATDWNSWGVDSADAGWIGRIYFTRARSNAVSCGVQLMGEGTRFRDLRVTAADRGEVLEWADNLYTSEMVPLTWIPGERVASMCPLSRNILKDGGNIRFVMLGDSIMNDMGNSAADVLIERAFPGSSVQIITAVGGGTGAGAWLRDSETSWPAHDLDLKAAAVETRPDLVMIGGISNGPQWRQDIQGLVGRLRTAARDASTREPEILLSTGAFGRVPDPDGYADGLRAMAKELDCGFLDLRKVTDDYLVKAMEAGYPKEYFYRDSIHANHRGKQLLGRILLKFFEAR